MSFKKYHVADNAWAQLDGGISTTDTVIAIKNKHNLGTETNWIGTLVQYAADGKISKQEKVHVTGATATNITVTRAYDGDVVKTFENDAYIFLNVVSEVIEDIQNNMQDKNEKNQASGYAGLDANGKIPGTHIPGQSRGSITNKPTSFPPSAHNHDARYYKKTETDTKLGTKADDSDVVKLTGDQTIPGNKTFSSPLTFSMMGGKMFNIGDDAEIHDVNAANTMGIIGKQDATKGKLQLGNNAGSYVEGINGATKIGGSTVHLLGTVQYGESTVQGSFGTNHKLINTSADQYFRFKRSSGHDILTLGNTGDVNFCEQKIIPSYGPKATLNANNFAFSRYNQSNQRLLELHGGGKKSFGYKTDTVPDRQLIFGSRHELSNIPHANKGHEFQFLRGDLATNTSTFEGTGHDGGRGLMFGPAGNPYIKMWANDTLVGRNPGGLYLNSHYMFAPNLPTVQPTEANRIRKDNGVLKIT